MRYLADFFRAIHLRPAPRALRVVAFLAFCFAAHSAPAQTPAAPDATRIRAEAGDPEAQNSVGNAYANGQGVPQDYAQALTWYRRAAEKGYAPAQFNLGLAYELGRGVTNDDRQAFRYYLQAATQGYAPAQFNVGNMFAVGRGVGQDLTEANVWLRQAAEKGVVEAQYNLGLVYEAGRGVKKDEVQAARWYKAAADRGFARAQYNLGLLYEDGRGVAQNDSSAADLYRAAAEQGYAPAQNNLGLLYASGRGGLTADPVQAYAWLSLAVENGAAPQGRDFVTKSMTPEQLASANQRLIDLRGQLARGGSRGTTRQVVAAADTTALNAQIRQLTDNLERAKSANAQLADANQRLTIELAQTQQKSGPDAGQATLVAQLRAQSQRLSEQVQQLTTERESAEQQAAQLSTQLKELQEKNAQRSTTGGADTAQVAQLRQQLGQMVDRLANAESAAAELKRANEQLGVTLAQLQQEKDKAATASGDTATNNDTTIRDLRRDNARLNDEVKRSTRELLALNAQIKRLQLQVPATGAPVAAPTTDDGGKDLAAARSESAQLKADNAKLLASNEDLRKQVSDGAAVRQKLESEKVELDKWAQSLEKDLNERNVSAKGAGEDVSRLQQQLTQAKRQAEQGTAELKRLETQNQQLLAENSELEPKAAQARQLADANARLEKELTTAQQGAKGRADALLELESMRKRIDGLVAENQRLGTVNSEHADDLEKLRARLADAGKSNAAGGAQVAEMQEKLTLAEAALASSRDDNGKLRAELMNAGKAINEKTAQFQQLTDTNARLTKDLTAAQQAVQGDSTSKTETAALQNRVDELSAENQRLTTTGSKAIDEVNDLRRQLDDVTRTMELTKAGAAEQSKLAQANKALVADKAGLEEKLAQTAGLQDKVAAAETGQKAMAAESAKLRTELQAVNESLKGKTAQNRELTDANARLQKDLLAAQQAAKGPSRKDVDALKTRVEELTAENQRLAVAGSKDSGAVTDLRHQLTEAEEGLQKNAAAVAELTGINDRLEKELADAKQQGVGAGEELVKARQQLESAQGENRRLTAAVADTRALDAAKAQIADLQKQLDEARIPTVRTRPGLDEAAAVKLRADLNEANQTTERLSAQVAELTGANDKLEKDLETAKKSAEAALAASAQAVNEAKGDAYKMEIGTLQARVKQLENSIEEERTNTANEISTLAGQLQRARDSNKSLTEANRALLAAKQADDSPTKEQFNESQGKVRDLTAALNEVRRQNEALTDGNQKIETERDALKQQLAEAQKEADSHGSSVTELTGANQKLEDERDGYKKQIDTLTAQLAAAQRNNTAAAGKLSDEKTELQERLEAVGSQLLKTQQENTDLKKQVAAATEQAQGSKDASDKVQADLAALQAKFDAEQKASEAHNASVAELTGANEKIGRENEDMRRLVDSYRADINRLTQAVRAAEQQRASADRGAQQNIDALTAQLAATRRDLESARTTQQRLADSAASQDRDRQTTIAQLRSDNAAQAARLAQAQGTLDQIAAAARLGTPAATIASGGAAPVQSSSPAPTAGQPRTHVVVDGDSLSRISMRYYGTPNRWQEIFNANRDVLQGSSTLRVGMQLRIP